MSINLSEIAVVLDTNNAPALAQFYADLLGWQILPEASTEEWTLLINPQNPATLALVIQQADDYQRPTWPNTPGQQQQMTHLDFYVADPAAAIAHALACGATHAETQFGDHWHVLIDPAGHPFCIMPKRQGT